MPVILTAAAEIDLWLLADAPKALQLQRPLPAGPLRTVASGEKEAARARSDALTGIKTQCFRFDALQWFQTSQMRFAATSNGVPRAGSRSRPIRPMGTRKSDGVWAWALMASGSL